MSGHVHDSLVAGQWCNKGTAGGQLPGRPEAPGAARVCKTASLKILIFHHAIHGLWTLSLTATLMCLFCAGVSS